jgi:hypothetical protein
MFQTSEERAIPLRLRQFFAALRLCVDFPIPNKGFWKNDTMDSRGLRRD